ncbi:MULTISPECIES: imidazole glycerol phosphate synthase subunit HisH [unclassified Adlercreutzia]|uniref:imidazole glycerol phosphate synthase subunit HisH n=1 Tax=unclassified Adlercreutzia TaxID=2636013 RepID=UPI0013EA4E05|nr:MULTISPECIES: imidazole glycerol phosphate synthase subunit HisH [unclassified Adlercreutzia]
MIAIVDYGLGNLGSIQNMLRVIGAKVIVTSDADDICRAEKLILPGVGAFDAGAERLGAAGLADVVRRQALDCRKPILGICLGMQLLGRGSEEGGLPGLGLIPFECRRFRLGDAGLKVPHMGWDVVTCERPDDPLVKGLSADQRYYFVHSYHAVCDSEENVLMTCDYGYGFAAAVVSGSVYGVQFHPEKSHNFGMALLKNFVERC